jgi:enoyl-CoA hydratase/carnithine racemase
VTDHPNPFGGEFVACSVRGAVAHLRLTRADKRNALNMQMAAEFEAITTVLAETGVIVCTLSGAGPLFCAGADLTETIGVTDTAPLERITHELMNGRFLWVCGLQGGAAGAGVALALVCSIVVAGDDAWLWLPELSRVGVLPIAVMRLLAPIIGMRAALTLGVLEQRVGATTALTNGWISEVTSPAEIDDRVAAIAEKLASAGAASVAKGSSLWLRGAGPRQ